MNTSYTEQWAAAVQVGVSGNLRAPHPQMRTQESAALILCPSTFFVSGLGFESVTLQLLVQLLNQQTTDAHPSPAIILPELQLHASQPQPEEHETILGSTIPHSSGKVNGWMDACCASVLLQNGTQLTQQESMDEFRSDSQNLSGRPKGCSVKSLFSNWNTGSQIWPTTTLRTGHQSVMLQAEQLEQLGDKYWKYNTFVPFLRQSIHTIGIIQFLPWLIYSSSQKQTYKELLANFGIICNTPNIAMKK